MKRIIFISITILFVLLLVGCDDSERQREEANRMRDKGNFAVWMYFENIFAMPRIRNAMYSHTLGLEVIFVHSEEEAADFHGEAFVLWPSQMSRGLMEAMNQHIADTELDLEQFSLTYPLTMEDLVYNWEGMRALKLYISMLPSGWFIWQNFERYASEKYWEEYQQNRDARYWLVPEGMLDALNEFTEGKDLSEFGLTWPITEEDVREDAPRLNDVFRLLTREEGNVLYNIHLEYIENNWSVQLERPEPVICLGLEDRTGDGSLS